MKVYIAGPMSGITDLNFPAFHEAAAHLRSLGNEVFNPAEMVGEQDEHTWEYWMRRDIRLISEVDAIAVLPGWESSRGATLEVHIARALAMPILDARTLEPVLPRTAPTALTCEQSEVLRLAVEWGTARFNVAAQERNARENLEILSVTSERLAKAVTALKEQGKEV